MPPCSSAAHLSLQASTFRPEVTHKGDLYGEAYADNSMIVALEVRLLHFLPCTRSLGSAASSRGSPWAAWLRVEGSKRMKDSSTLPPAKTLPLRRPEGEV